MKQGKRQRTVILLLLRLFLLLLLRLLHSSSLLVTLLLLLFLRLRAVLPLPLLLRNQLPLRRRDGEFPSVLRRALGVPQAELDRVDGFGSFVIGDRGVRGGLGVGDALSGVEEGGRESCVSGRQIREREKEGAYESLAVEPFTVETPHGSGGASQVAIDDPRAPPDLLLPRVNNVEDLAVGAKEVVQGPTKLCNSGGGREEGEVSDEGEREGRRGERDGPSLGTTE